MRRAITMENKVFYCEIDATEAAIRSAIEQSRKYGNVIQKEIRLRPGICHLSAPIALDERDTGLTLRGSGKQECCLDCGTEITGWSKRPDLLWECEIPKGIEPRMLAKIIDGKLEIRERSCYPSNGTLTNLDKTDVQWMSSQFGGWNRKPSIEERSRMTVRPDDLPPSFSVENAEITQFHIWDESTTLVKSYNPQDGVIQFASPAEHPAGAFDRHGYVIRNTMAGMEKPGCWMFDRTASKIIYHPLPDEEATGPQDYRIPVLENAIHISGTTNITLDNLTIRGANSNTMTPGLRAINPPGAIYADKSTSLTLSNIRILQCAGQAIKTMQCKELHISNCTISDCGAGGILCMESMPATIEDNTIFRIGRLNYSAPAITAGGKSLLVYVQDGSVPEEDSCLVKNNIIEDAPYCGICCCGGPHCIEGNTVSNVMLKLHDGGAIYVSRGYKTVLRGNKAYKIGSLEDSTCHAYYLDELSCDCLVENNIALECVSPFHAHKSVDCTLRSNRFFSSSALKMGFLNCCNYHLLGNVMMAMKKITFYNMNEHVFAERNDEVYSPEGPCEFLPVTWHQPDFAFVRTADGQVDFNQHP